MDGKRPRYALTCIDWRQPRGAALLAAKVVAKGVEVLTGGKVRPLASRPRRG